MCIQYDLQFVLADFGNTQTTYCTVPMMDTSSHNFGQLHPHWGSMRPWKNSFWVWQRQRFGMQLFSNYIMIIFDNCDYFIKKIWSISPHPVPAPTSLPRVPRLHPLSAAAEQLAREEAEGSGHGSSSFSWTPCFSSRWWIFGILSELPFFFKNIKTS